MPAVADASFIMGALVEEEHTDFVVQAFPDLAVEGLVAPALVMWEVANICATKQRRGLLTAEEAQEALDLFLSLPIDLDAELTSLSDGLALARRHGLTAYDAAYLELAARVGGALATLDKALTRAARAEGLFVLSPFA
jgi:predicted nucleic acid-binding protein